MILFLLTLLASPVHAANLRACLDPLHQLDYEKGLKTEQGNTPAAFFARPTRGRRPRVVMTVGIAGSGKSTWVNEAKKNGWVILSLDDIRIEILTEKRARGELIELPDKTKVIPDPHDPAHQQEVNREAKKRAGERYMKAMEEGKPVVWDATNVGVYRATQLAQARDRGYCTEALVFDSPSVQVNSNNIGLRVAGGGRDLAGDGAADPVAGRLAVLARMQNDMLANPVVEKPDVFTNVGTPPPKGTDPKPFQKANDYFNHVEHVVVQDWSLPR